MVTPLFFRRIGLHHSEKVLPCEKARVPSYRTFLSVVIIDVPKIPVGRIHDRRQTMADDFYELLDERGRHCLKSSEPQLNRMVAFALFVDDRVKVVFEEQVRRLGASDLSNGHASSPEKQPSACIDKVSLHHAGNVVITMRRSVRHLPHLENRLPTVTLLLNSAERCRGLIVEAVWCWECCSAKMRPTTVI